jgi:ubiquinone/menaquinone biosynthesis C-methylase UbiE
VDEPRFDVEQIFDDDYLFFYAPRFTDEVSEAQTERIVEMLGLESGMSILDVACGYGRIANRLAARGMRVTGLDITPQFLELARKDAAERRVYVDYVHGDMRALPFSQQFDAVLCFFTAFGYFDDAGCRKTLEEFRRVLHPGGRVLIDINNIWAILRGFTPAVIEERDGALLIDRRRIDPVASRVVSERIVVRGGNTKRAEYFVRFFTFTELRDWLLAAGFASVEAFGEDGQPLNADHRRLIAVARR